jgi:hypothetical protein
VQAGKESSPDERQKCCQIVMPGTILAWLRNLAVRKCDSFQRKTGRPRKSRDVRKLVMMTKRFHQGIGSQLIVKGIPNNASGPTYGLQNDEGSAYSTENDNVLDIDKGVTYTINLFSRPLCCAQGDCHLALLEQRRRRESRVVRPGGDDDLRGGRHPSSVEGRLVAKALRQARFVGRVGTLIIVDRFGGATSLLDDI